MRRVETEAVRAVMRINVKGRREKPKRDGYTSVYVYD